MTIAEHDFKGYTGGLIEDEILGHCPEIIEWRRTGYLRYHKAKDLAKHNQPQGWDPTDPPTRTANDLHAYVVEGLDADYADVGLYTSAQTAFDRFHGVDAFFEYEGHTVTLDLTLNKNKDSYKADVILRPGYIKEAADEVVSIYKSSEHCRSECSGEPVRA